MLSKIGGKWWENRQNAENSETFPGTRSKIGYFMHELYGGSNPTKLVIRHLTSGDDAQNDTLFCIISQKMYHFDTSMTFVRRISDGD